MYCYVRHTQSLAQFCRINKERELKSLFWRHRMTKDMTTGTWISCDNHHLTCTYTRQTQCTEVTSLKKNTPQFSMCYIENADWGGGGGRGEERKNLIRQYPGAVSLPPSSSTPLPRPQKRRKFKLNKETNKSVILIPLMSEFSFSMRISSSVSSMAFFHRARSSVDDFLLLPSVPSVPTWTWNKTTNTVLSITFKHKCHISSSSIHWLHVIQLIIRLLVLNRGLALRKTIFFDSPDGAYTHSEDLTQPHRFFFAEEADRRKWNTPPYCHRRFFHVPEQKVKGSR